MSPVTTPQSITKFFNIESLPYSTEPLHLGLYIWKLNIWEDHDENELVTDMYIMKDGEAVCEEEDTMYVIWTVKVIKSSSLNIRHCKRFKSRAECDDEEEWNWRGGLRHPEFYEEEALNLEVTIKEHPNGNKWSIEDFLKMESWEEDMSRPETWKKGSLHRRHVRRSIRYDSIDTELEKIQNTEDKLLQMLKIMRLEMQEIKDSVSEVKKTQVKMQEDFKESMTALKRENEELRMRRSRLQRSQNFRYPKEHMLLSSNGE